MSQISIVSEVGAPTTDEFGHLSNMTPPMLSELEPTISLSGEEIQKLVMEYPILYHSIEGIINSKTHNDHPYVITMEEKAANIIPHHEDETTLDNLESHSSAESIPFIDSDLNDDIGVDVLSATPLTKIRGRLIESHKMKYFGK